MEKKRCPGCQQEKDRAEFYRNRSARDGLNSYCKSCWKARIDAAIKSGKHGEYCRKTQAGYRADPVKRAALNERQREWQKRRPENPARRAKNRARSKAHYVAHQEDYVCRVSARKARLFGSGGSHSSEAWRQMKELFGNRCLCCGRTERITKDHIIPVLRGGSDDILNIQPLCIWCNKSKFTGDKDYRTRDKVVLAELNAVGKLLFNGKVGRRDAAKLEKHKPASRLTGVYFCPKAENSAKPWRAIITVDKKRIDLGRHTTKEQAGEAYNQAAKKYRVTGGYLNDVPSS